MLPRLHMTQRLKGRAWNQGLVSTADSSCHHVCSYDLHSSTLKPNTLTLSLYFLYGYKGEQ